MRRQNNLRRQREGWKGREKREKGERGQRAARGKCEVHHGPGRKLRKHLQFEMREYDKPKEARNKFIYY